MPLLPYHFKRVGTARSEVAVYLSMTSFSAGACALPMVLGFLTDEVSQTISILTLFYLTQFRLLRPALEPAVNASACSSIICYHLH